MIAENHTPIKQSDAVYYYVARIFNRNGKAVGAGFVTGANRLLTPRHVIQNAVGVIQPSAAGTLEIFFDLPLISPGEKTSALLNFNEDDIDEKGRFKAGHDSVDVVLLEIKEAHFSASCNMAFLPAADLIGHEFWTYGFPQNFENEGAAVIGKITSPRPSGLVQLQEKDQTVFFIQQGFSGAPVWDMGINAVVAMVVSVAEKEKIAVALSLETILGKYPVLSEDALFSLRQNYKANSEPLIANPENEVASPLDTDWDDFQKPISWHSRVLQEKQNIKLIAGNFTGFDTLLKRLANISPTSSYPKLHADLKKLYESECIQQTNQSLHKHKNELEKLTKTSAYTARRRKNPAPAEEKLIEIDSLQYHYNELRKILDRPSYQKCFLSTGGLGSGKTYFLNRAQQWAGEIESALDECFLIPLEPPETNLDFSALALKAVKQRLGMQFASIEQIHHHFDTLNRALDLYKDETRNRINHSAPKFSFEDEDQRHLDREELDAIKQEHNHVAQIAVPAMTFPLTHVRLYFTLDDLSRWESHHHQMIRDWMKVVKDWSAYHAIYWIATMPLHFYPMLVRDSGMERDFWRQYGCDFLTDTTSTLDGWIVLDDLNLWLEIGLDILREFRFETAANDKVQGLLGLIEQNERLQRILCNPFNALTLTAIFPRLNVHTILDLNFIDIMDEFCTQQFTAILSKDMNILNPRPITQAQLLQATDLLATFLSKTGDMSPRFGTMIREISSESSRLGYDLSDPSQADFALRLLATSNLLNITQPSRSSEVPSERLEFLFESFWQYRLARILCREDHLSNTAQQGLEVCLSRYEPSQVPGILEFFLLILVQKNEAATSIKVFEQVLGSITLPRSAVWFAAAKTSLAIQSALLPHLDLEVHKPHDQKELHALLYFINELSYGTLSFDRVIKTLQPLYPQIKDAGMERFMIYIIASAFDNTQSMQQIVKGMPYFSGIEIFDVDYQGSSEGLIAHEVAEMTVIFLSDLVKKRQDKADLDEECFAEVALLILDYLISVNKEYIHKDQLPQKGKTWKRQLYREWVMFHFLQDLTTTREIGSYAYHFMKRLHWFDQKAIQQNHLLSRQMEQELNIALGKLITHGSWSRRNLIELVTSLAAADNVFDRRNAFHIIRHTVPTSSGLLLRRIDREFHPILEKLYFDPALSDIAQEKIFQPVFEQLENFGQMRKASFKKPAPHKKPH